MTEREALSAAAAYLRDKLEELYSNITWFVYVEGTAELWRVRVHAQQGAAVCKQMISAHTMFYVPLDTFAQLFGYNTSLDLARE